MPPRSASGLECAGGEEVHGRTTVAPSYPIISPQAER